MAVETMPTALSKRPEFAPVFEALAAYRSGARVTSRCHKCGHTLVVTDFPEIGSRWVKCDTGCTSYHEKYKPERTQVA